jgi:nicotinate-nucleotide adenylyltransferase
MLAILGGTFDPIHQTHVALALAVRAQLPEAEIRLMPNALPPHRASPGVNAQHRLAMCRLATADYPFLRVDDYELKQSTPSYTINSLLHLRAELGPEQALAWIMGADAYNKIHTWHQHDELLKLGHFIVCTRPGNTLHLKQKTTLNSLTQQAAGLLAEFIFPDSHVSATAIRAQLARGDTPSADVLHPKVLHYIRQHHLYV